MRSKRFVALALVLAMLGGAVMGTSAVAPRGSLFALGIDPSAGATGTVLSIRYPAPSLGGSHPALIYLPGGYGASSVRYPVVEMLHGVPGSPNDIVTGLNLMSAAAQTGIPKFIGVMPDGHGPAVYNGEFANTARQQLGTAASGDLRAYVDAHYRTNGRWSVTGLSSGGYGAAYLGALRPGQYESVCAMSGNFIASGPAFAGAPRAVQAADSPQLHSRRDGPRTLLVAGRSDPTRVREAYAYARAQRATGQIHRVVIAPGGHDWSFWSQQFPRCLRFLLGIDGNGGRPQ